MLRSTVETAYDDANRMCAWQMFEFRWHQTQLTFLEVLTGAVPYRNPTHVCSAGAVLRRHFRHHHRLRCASRDRVVLLIVAKCPIHAGRQETSHLSALEGNFSLGWPCAPCSSLLYVLARTLRRRHRFTPATTAPVHHCELARDQATTVPRFVNQREIAEKTRSFTLTRRGHAGEV